jgi:hypothetical protein
LSKSKNKIVGAGAEGGLVTDSSEKEGKARRIMRSRGLVGGALCMVTFILAIDRCAEEKGLNAEASAVEEESETSDEPASAPVAQKKPVKRNPEAVEQRKPQTEVEKKFQTEVLSEKEMPVLVIFWSSQRDGAIFRDAMYSKAESFAASMKEKVKIYTVDKADIGGKNLADLYLVGPAPCLMIFKNGKPAEDKKWYFTARVKGNESDAQRYEDRNVASEIIDLTNKHIQKTRDQVGTLKEESRPQ